MQKFHENNDDYQRVDFTRNVWKKQKFYLVLFSKKFRESNGFTKEITK